MGERFSNTRSRELAQAFGKGALAIGVAGFAAGRQHDRQWRIAIVPLETDAVDVGEAELVAGEFRDDPDAGLLEAFENGADRRRRRRGKVEGHASVHRLEDEPVAVALQEFHQAVPRGPIAIGTGAHAVGDQRREGLVAVSQIVGREGDDVDRDEHGRAVAQTSAFDPVEPGRAIDRRAGRQAQRQRIRDPPPLP